MLPGVRGLKKSILTNMDIKEHINAEIKKYKNNSNIVFISPRIKDLTISHVESIVSQLLIISKQIRDNKNLPTLTPRESRYIYDINYGLLAIGQAIASDLFKLNLRDNISEVIENYYGIRYNSLKILNKVIDKDFVPVYFSGAYFYEEYLINNPDISYCKDGKLLCMTRSNFITLFENQLKEQKLIA